MRFLIPAAVLFGGLLAITTPVDAKPDLTKKEKKGCTYCHTTAKGPDLTEAGKYYKEKRSFEGYVPKK